MNSLERSLQVGLISSLVILLFVFWWAITLSSRLLIESYVFMRLENEAQNIVSTLEFDPVNSTWPRMAPFKLHRAYNEPASGHFYMVSFAAGPVLMSRSSWEQSFTVHHLSPGESRRLRLRGFANAPLLMWVGGYVREGWQFTISVAQDINPIVKTLRIFQWFAAAVATLLLLALLGVQRLVMKRSVNKLNAIRRDMQRLEQGKVVALSEDVPTEIIPLVREFNQLLRRFDQRLRQSRNAVGNLAHALKGPLNLLLRSTETSDIEESEKKRLVDNAQHIRKLIETELKRARLAGRSAVGKRFDIAAELPAMFGLLKQVYSDKSVDVRFSADSDMELMHDRQDMLELVGNLLDNAAKWCRSVVVITIRRNNGIVIDVEDDGPGCSPEVLSQLTGRGVRLDESVAGHGLGLSIVNDIVDIYDGQLRLQPSKQLGGLHASVYLPDRPATTDLPPA